MIAGGLAKGGDRLLLDLWDRAGAAPPVLRPAVLLDGLRELAGLPVKPPADDLPIGQRDLALMQLRARVFGPQVLLQADCPACGERFDLLVDLLQLAEQSAAPQPAALQVGDAALPLRPPSTKDLAAVITLPAPSQAGALLARCALAPLPQPLTPSQIEAGGQALALADPLADIQLDSACPACGTAQTLGFDIGASLWDDLTRLTRRLLREVHHLARAYGWTESQVLSIPAARRREYIQMAGAR